MADDYESVDNEKSWECIDGIFLLQSKNDQDEKLEKKTKIKSPLKGKISIK